MKFYEDIPLGERLEIGSHTFAADEIKAFAAAFDPQPFHLDEARAAESHFGGLIASGWHSAAIWMRLFVGYAERVRREAAQAGIPVPHFGPSPGFEELKWLKPVRAGEIVAYTMTFIDKRESRSRPGWGVVTMLAEGRNGAGELAISFKPRVLVAKREG